jgi:Tfp pilus assembly protein PilF
MQFRTERVQRGHRRYNVTSKSNTNSNKDRRILKSQSENLDALYLRGKAFYKLGQNEAATNHYMQALRYDPDNTKCRTEYKVISN